MSTTLGLAQPQLRQLSIGHQVGSLITFLEILFSLIACIRLTASPVLGSGTSSDQIR